jgi:uncharacterized protein (DUF362 family)
VTVAIAARNNNEYGVTIENLFSELGFKPGRRVFVKPNLCGREPVLPGENTSIEVMDALLSVLLLLGCEVTIGHGELLGSFDQQTPFSETLKASRFDKYLGMSGVRVLNLDELPRTVVKTAEMTFHLPLEFLKNQIDSYINLAKIKTHMETTVSLSLKNQMGLPSKADRVAMHKINLEMCIARLATLCRPDLSILEGCPAMEGDGPHHGSARNLNLIVAGDDMVELDSSVACLLGYEAEQIKHLLFSAELDVGKFIETETLEKLEEFKVVGFLHANKAFRFGRTVTAYPTYSCSRCICAVQHAGRSIRRHPLKHGRFLLKALLGTERTAVVFGRADKASIPIADENRRLICIGSCAKVYAESHGVDCLDKCPPGLDEALRYITK